MKIYKGINKLNNEKGITGIDVTIGLTVIVIAIAVVSIVYANIDLGNKSVTRTAGATRIITNVLENIEKLSYDEFNTLLTSNTNTESITYRINNLSESISKIESITESVEEGEEEQEIGKRYVISGKEFDSKVFNTKIPSGYTLILEVTNSYGTNSSNIKLDLVKNINAKVKFNVGKGQEEVSLAVVKEKESIPYCNPPDLNSSDFKTNELRNKIIIPIKYSISYNSYIITDENDEEWYNYYTKDWAKVLVIDETYESTFFDNNGRLKKEIVIDEETVDLNDYIYYWIPNFSIDDGEIAHFRYGKTKNIIEQKSKNFENEEESKFYYNAVGDELEDYEFEDDESNMQTCEFENSGVWRKLDSDFYFTVFNNTQFGEVKVF